MSNSDEKDTQASTALEVQLEPTSASQYALELDQRIKTKVDEANRLALAHLELGVLLKEMKDSQAYKELNFHNWEAYLKTFDWSRSYLARLLKLGQAGDLTPYVARGMGASMIIEYARHINHPEKIPGAIDDTFEEVVDLPIREARISIAKYVAANEASLKKPRKASNRVRATNVQDSLMKPVKQRLIDEYIGLPSASRGEFVSEIEAALQEMMESA